MIPCWGTPDKQFGKNLSGRKWEHNESEWRYAEYERERQRELVKDAQEDYQRLWINRAIFFVGGWIVGGLMIAWIIR